MTSNRKLTLPMLLAPLALVALSACSPRGDDRTAGEKLDSAIATTEQKADAARQNASEMGDKMANAASDASITASVNAELAKDSQLSALKIDVDTEQGNVVLKGTAPDAMSADRATTLASSVKGVVKVDNQLTVSGN